MGKRLPGSAIDEVKQDLFLDTADGVYLNNVTANLGFERPKFGFSDDTWRAVAKEVAVNYKQILSKFEDVLSIVLGPRLSQYTGLARDAFAGDSKLYLHSTKNIPQVGTVVIDKGLPTEERLAYDFVDRGRKIMYLTDPVSFDHIAHRDVPTAVVVVPAAQGDTVVRLSNTDLLPLVFPYSLILSPGTDAEEVVSVLGADPVTKEVTVSPLQNSHDVPKVSTLSTSLASRYVKNSYVLHVTDASQLPPSGFVQVRAEIPCTAGTGATVSVTDPLVVGELVGARVQGTVSPNWSATVESNTAFQATLTGSLTVADPLEAWVWFQYGSVDYAANTLNLRNTYSFDIAGNSQVEVLETAATTASMAQVLVERADWFIVEPHKHKIEIHVGSDLTGTNDPRTAAYLHGNRPQILTTTLTATASVGDELLTVADTTGFGAYTLVDIAGTLFGVSVVDGTTLRLTQPLEVTLASGSTVLEVDTTYTGDDTWDGNHPRSWYGPYLFSTDTVTPFNLVNPTQILTPLIAPALLAVDQVPNTTAIELVDGSFFPSTGYPLDIQLSPNTGHAENVVAQGIWRKSGLGTAVASPVSAGATTFDVVDGSVFPPAKGYRLLVAGAPGESEIVVVQGVVGNTITCTPLQYNHTSPHGVSLVSDVLRVDVVNNLHYGVVTYANRFIINPTVESTAYVSANKVAPLYSAVTLSDVTGFPVSGYLYLNFGRNQVERTATLTAPTTYGASQLYIDTTGWPQAPFPVTIAPGTPDEVTMWVSSTTSTYLQLSGFVYTVYPVDTVVYLPTGKEELLEYTSIQGNTLTLPNPVSVKYNHIEAELAVAGQILGVPRPDGYDYAFHLPANLLERLQVLLDRIRAAGVELTFVVDY